LHSRLCPCPGYAEAHRRALKDIDRLSGSAFNVGTGAGHSIRQVIDAVRRVTGSKISEKVLPRRPGDPAELVASGEKLQRELNWQPTHSSLDEIIASAGLGSNPAQMAIPTARKPQPIR